MDIRCKNCGQMIDENDKYCKYCGYLIPPKEEKPKLTEKQIEDKLQEQKATITAEEMETASLFDTQHLQVKHIGDKKSVYTRSMLSTLGCVLLGAIFFGVAWVGKLVEMNKTIALTVLCLSMFFTLCCFGFAMERYMNTKAIHSLKDNAITVKKYGFKKPAEFLVDDHIFEVDVLGACPKCTGDIIGDLHIEKIEKMTVVVCNINRKHYWILDDEDVIKKVKNGEIKPVDKKAKK